MKKQYLIGLLGIAALSFPTGATLLTNSQKTIVPAEETIYTTDLAVTEDSKITFSDDNNNGLDNEDHLQSIDFKTTYDNDGDQIYPIEDHYGIGIYNTGSQNAIQDGVDADGNFDPEANPEELIHFTYAEISAIDMKQNDKTKQDGNVNISLNEIDNPNVGNDAYAEENIWEVKDISDGLTNVDDEFGAVADDESEYVVFADYSMHNSPIVEEEENIGNIQSQVIQDVDLQQLGGGAIFGIIAGVFILVGVIGYGGYYLYKKYQA